jgi:hypothetical protein
LELIFLPKCDLQSTSTYGGGGHPQAGWGYHGEYQLQTNQQFMPSTSSNINSFPGHHHQTSPGQKPHSAYTRGFPNYLTAADQSSFQSDASQGKVN